MNALLLLVAEENGNAGLGVFDEAKVAADLGTIAGVTALQRGDFIGSHLQCSYAFRGDQTLVRLSDDCQSITIHGMGDASLQIALELQRRESRPLRVVDFAYSFDFVLAGIKSVEEFSARIHAAELLAA